MSETGNQVGESTTDGSEPTGDASTTGSEPSGTTSAAGDFKPITSQAELDKALKDRLGRERAKFADYGDLKTKAAEFDKITEAQKSDLQKQIERAEAAERDLATMRAAREIDDWKTQVSKDTGIPADVLRGTTLEDLQAHAESLKALLPEPRKPGHVPSEGRTVTPGKGDAANDFAAALRQAGLPS